MNCSKQNEPAVLGHWQDTSLKSTPTNLLTLSPPRGSTLVTVTATPGKVLGRVPLERIISLFSFYILV